eukprot:412123-Amphidinium_carterae.1
MDEPVPYMLIKAPRPKALGEEDLVLPSSYSSSMGNMGLGQDKLADAIEFYRQVLAVFIKVKGQVHVDAKKCYNVMAHAYHSQDFEDLALAFRKRELDMRVKLLVADCESFVDTFVPLVADLAYLALVLAAGRTCKRTVEQIMDVPGAQSVDVDVHGTRLRRHQFVMAQMAHSPLEQTAQDESLTEQAREKNDTANINHYQDNEDCAVEGLGGCEINEMSLKEQVEQNFDHWFNKFELMNASFVGPR